MSSLLRFFRKESTPSKPRKRKPSRRPQIDSLEERLTLTASSFGFVTIGNDLYFEVRGDRASADIMTAYTDVSGDSTVNVKNGLGEATYSVSAGYIGLAQLQTGATYKGLLLRGLAGDDLIDASQLTGDRAKIMGDHGHDTIFGSPNADELIGGKGDDTIFGGAGNDILRDSDHNNTLNGGLGADKLIGGSGQDLLIADEADTFIRGGGNRDRIVFEGAMAGVTFDNRDIETVVGSKYDDVIDNSKFAGPDGVRVFARAGDDTIMSSAAGDLIDGQAGNDTISYEKAAAGVQVNLQHTIQNSPGTDSHGDELRSIENVIGSDFNDSITGNDDANTLHGGDGDDYIEGRDGDDKLIGGNGNDQLFGDRGNDTLNGGHGSDGLFGGLGVDTLVVDWENLDDLHIFGFGEADIFRYRNVMVNGLVDVSRVDTIDAYLNNLGDDNQSDFDEGVDLTEYFD